MITSLDETICFSKRHHNETIRMIIRYDSGYLKDLFLKDDRICFTPECFSEICKLTRGHKDNWEKPTKSTTSVFSQLKPYAVPYLYDFNDDNLKFINEDRLTKQNLKSMKQDFSLVSNVLEKDPEYPDGLKYPFYTHKHANGSGTGLVWICEDCGYTAEFSYRNDMICADAVCYCKRCKCSQLLNFYYNGQYKPHVCCECKTGDQLEEWKGDICPKCGGKIKQFNAFHIKQKYKNYDYYYLDKNVTIFDTIREKGI